MERVNRLTSQQQRDSVYRPITSLNHGMALSQCLRLPTSLLVDVLSNWISTEDLGCLDSALLRCRKDRQIFEDTIHTPYFCSIGLSDRLVKRAGHQYILWLSRRNLRVKKLVVIAPHFQNFPAVYNVILDTLLVDNINELRIDGNGDLYNLVKLVIAKSKGVHHLSFANMPWLTYPRMRALLKVCNRTLSTLEIDTVKYLAGSHFVRLVPYFHNLHELKLGRIPLNAELLTELTTGCRKLTSVSFSSCAVNMESLVEFISSYAGTVATRIYSGKSTNAMLRKDLGTSTRLHTSCQLQSLSLQHNTQINMTQIASCIAIHCKALRSLTLVGEYSTENALHTESVVLIAKHCNLLEYIDISKNNYITDEAIASIVAHCPGLNTLILHSCRGVTNIAVEYVAMDCKQLQVLDLSWCDHVTDRSLQTLACSSAEGVRKTLISLKINSCYRITLMRSVTDLVESCANLTVDNVSCTFTKLL